MGRRAESPAPHVRRSTEACTPSPRVQAGPLYGPPPGHRGAPLSPRRRLPQCAPPPVVAGRHDVDSQHHMSKLGSHSALTAITLEHSTICAAISFASHTCRASTTTLRYSCVHGGRVRATPTMIGKITPSPTGHSRRSSVSAARRRTSSSAGRGGATPARGTGRSRTRQCR